MSAVAEEQQKLDESSNYFFNLALKYIEDNDITSAIGSLKKSLNIVSDDVETINLLGLCYYLECDFNLACSSWQKSVKISQINNRAIEYLKFINTDRFKQFLKEYNSALETMSKGEYQRALEEFQNINAEKKQYIEIPMLIGICYYYLEDYEQSWNYFSQALNMDNGNQNALYYLNQINDKVNIMSIKDEIEEDVTNPKIDLLKNIAIVVMAILLLICTVQLIRDYLDNINGYNIRKQNAISKKIQTNKPKNKKSSVNQKANVYIVNNEQAIFNNAVNQYKKADYSGASVNFKRLIKYGIDYSIVEESTYFEASCYEHLNNSEQALNYYSIYIKKYKNENYYEESLYNAGLYAYKTGQRDLAKIFLRKLVNDVPNSQFNNSNVEFILSQK